MAEKFVSKRNLDFLLYEVHGVERLSTLPYFEDHTRETYDLVMDTALKLSRNLLYPYLRISGNRSLPWSAVDAKAEPQSAPTMPPDPIASKASLPGSRPRSSFIVSIARSPIRVANMSSPMTMKRGTGSSVKDMTDCIEL